MGNGISDVIGIESIAEDFFNALKEIQANATIEFRNVALTAINFAKSFTPIINLMIVFLLLLILFGILSILSRMLADLDVNKSLRRYILLAVAIILYICFVAIQIIAVVQDQSPTNIAIATLAVVGLVVLIILSVWLICRTSRAQQSSSDNDLESANIQTQKHRTRDANDHVPKYFDIQI